MAAIDDIQNRYVAELLELRPSIEKWWLELSGTANLGDPAPDEIRLRWPTRWSGHPRILHVFRKYFLEIEDMNREIRDSVSQDSEPEDPELRWGTDGPHAEIRLKRPVDALINEISSISPQAHQLVEGIVFIPVGMDMNNEPY
jgi:hypothetical protein